MKIDNRDYSYKDFEGVLFRTRLSLFYPRLGFLFCRSQGPHLSPPPSVIPVVEYRSWGVRAMGGGWRGIGVSARRVFLPSSLVIGKGGWLSWTCNQLLVTTGS